MTLEPLESQIRSALQQLAREVPSASPNFTERVLAEVTVVKNRREGRMRKGKMFFLFALAVCIGVVGWRWREEFAVFLRQLTLAPPLAEQTEPFVPRAVNAVMIYLEGTIGALLMAVSGIVALSCLPLRRFKLAATFCTMAMSCFLLRSMMSTFFNDMGIQDGGGSYNDQRIQEVGNNYGYTKPLPSQYPMDDLIALPRPLAYESYGTVAENKRISVSSEPVSTFSADVDTGSYSNMRRFIHQGKLPPPESVRIEEYLNYFNFDCNDGKGRIFNSCYEIAESPYESGRHLLKMTIKSKEAPLPADLGWNLVFLVDVSGSMSDQMKLPLVQQSLKLLVGKMRPIDRIAVVTYAGHAGVALPSTYGDDKSAILSAIDRLSSGGGTAGSAGINAAYQIAQESFIPGSVNRVVLATDGDFNVGVTSFDALIRLIEEKRMKGVTLTALGFGEGNIQEHLMEQLADKGNGNYFYIDSYQQARRVLEHQFTANMQVVAKDVKLQVEFNPAHVTSYRLIGFDNRRLSTEDFSDDKKDAGEVGSGHSVTALYEVTLNDSPLAAAAIEARRYAGATPTAAAAPTAPRAHDEEFGVLRIRYQPPEGGVSELIELPMNRSAIRDRGVSLPEDYTFAVAVAGFGEYLRKGSFSAPIAVNTVLALARQSIGSDADGSRHEFVALAEDAERLAK